MKIKFFFGFFFPFLLLLLLLLFSSQQDYLGSRLLLLCPESTHHGQPSGAKLFVQKGSNGPCIDLDHHHHHQFGRHLKQTEEDPAHNK